MRALESFLVLTNLFPISADLICLSADCSHESLHLIQTDRHQHKEGKENCCYATANLVSNQSETTRQQEHLSV